MNDDELRKLMQESHRGEEPLAFERMWRRPAAQRRPWGVHLAALLAAAGAVTLLLVFIWPAATPQQYAGLLPDGGSAPSSVGGTSWYAI